MRKVFLLVLCLSVLAALGQEWLSRAPTASEERAAAVGVLDFEYVSGSNTVTSGFRGGEAVVGTSASSLVVTNAAITTNALIGAWVNYRGTDSVTNHVTSVTPSDGSFTVRLRATPQSNAYVRFFIHKY